MDVHAIYVCVAKDEVDELRADPSKLIGVALQPALDEGRAVDLGRAWEELGCLIEGGIRTPESGPTVGDEAVATTEEGVAWNAVRPERVRHYAEHTLALGREQFMALFSLDDAETADAMPGDRTREWSDSRAYLFERLQALRALYARAAAEGDAVLVRLGPQRRARLMSRILIVDDDETNRAMLGRALRGVAPVTSRPAGRKRWSCSPFIATG
jgi:hypothetical protein